MQLTSEEEAMPRLKAADLKTNTGCGTDGVHPAVFCEVVDMVWVWSARASTTCSFLMQKNVVSESTTALRTIMSVLCGYFAHPRRLRFEDTVSEPPRTD